MARVASVTRIVLLRESKFGGFERYKERKLDIMSVWRPEETRVAKERLG